MIVRFEEGIESFFSTWFEYHLPIIGIKLSQRRKSGSLIVGEY
jgi:hypothetical protein